MEPLIAAALGLLLGAACATRLGAHRRRAMSRTPRGDVHHQVRALALQFRSEAPASTQVALDTIHTGIAGLRVDTNRLLDTIANQTQEFADLKQGEASSEQVLAATRSALQTHITKVSEERDGLVNRMDQLKNFAHGGLEYSQPLPSIVGVDLDDLPTEPPDLPFDLRGGGPSRGRA